MDLRKSLSCPFFYSSVISRGENDQILPGFSLGRNDKVIKAARLSMLQSMLSDKFLDQIAVGVHQLTAGFLVGKIGNGFW